jgi:aryl-alcohol dehydrogenase-like predicted oxidoreductase
LSTHPGIGGLPLVLGGNVFGWTADRDGSFAVLDAFHAAGGRMIDTAEAYSAWVPGHKGGESETVIGQWLASRGLRGEMLIATKTNVMGMAGGLRPEALAEHLQASLDRLQTDYVDLFYAHRDDPETPQDEVADGFEALRKLGLIREVGASNFSAERLTSAIAAARRIGAAPYSVLQNQHNLVHRESYDPALQALCTAEGVAVLPFYALAAGYLTGKYRQPEDFAANPRGQRCKDFVGKGEKILPVMDAIAAETGATLPEIAIAWLRAQPRVSAPIASAVNLAQLETLIRAVGLELSAEQLERLTAAYE